MRRKRLHDLLLGSTPSSETKAQQAMAQPHLTERQVRALNQAGESLARAESGGAGVAAEPLGAAPWTGRLRKMKRPCLLAIGGSNTWAIEIDVAVPGLKPFRRR